LSTSQQLPLQLTDHQNMRLPSRPLPAVRHSADISTPKDAVAIACTALLLAVIESFCECFAETHASQATRFLRRATRTACAAWYLTTSLPCKLLAKAMCTLRAASACLRITAPATHRELAGTNKIIPILASYLVKRRRCRRITDSTARNEAWDAQHAWGAERARRMVRDLGGFYTKVGQIAAAGAQMMPPAWCAALAETMDAAPPVCRRVIRRIVERDLGVRIADAFDEWDDEPVATASVAQVHRASVNGTQVAVKVGLGRQRRFSGDVDAMYRQAVLLKALKMDAGLDLPSVVAAYCELVKDEFDFRVELSKLDNFSRLIQKDFRNFITTPAPLRHLCGERVLTCEWLAGPQLLDVFRESKAALPRPQARTFGSWRRLYATLHSCWGAQIFRQGEFHTDPHPGNVVLLQDGRVGLLDWGQTKVLPPDKVDSCAECVVCMARGDAEGLARTIEASGIAELENPSVALWALISYTYFDTRWTPLAGVNLYDVDRSLLARDGFRRNSPVEACVEINVASMAWGAEV
jgi:aarF domain-containing kinase